MWQRSAEEREDCVAVSQAWCFDLGSEVARGVQRPDCVGALFASANIVLSLVP